VFDAIARNVESLLAGEPLPVSERKPLDFTTLGPLALALIAKLPSDSFDFEASPAVQFGNPGGISRNH
jgi:hypothetical protein